MDIPLTWTNLKNIALSRNLNIQFVVQENKYLVFATEHMLFWFCEIPITDPAGADQTEFEAYQPICNSPINEIVSFVKPAIPNRSWIFSQNLCDKTSWFGDSIRVTNETLGTGDGSTVTFNFANQYIIDLKHGKISDESNIKPTASQGGTSFIPEITVDSVVKAEREYGATSGGDYTIDYVAGSITFLTAPANGKTIVATQYFYSPANSGSTNYIRPSSGKVLHVTVAECMFTDDIELNDNLISGVFTYNPGLGAPPAKFEYPGSRGTYKSFYDYINYTNGSFPIIPALGGTNVRAQTKDVYQLRFDYVGEIKLPDAYGAELRIWLENHIPFSGTRAYITFYGYETDA